MTQSLARETKERLLCSVSSKEPQECETETFLMITFNEMIQLAFQLSFDKTETQLMQLNCDLVRLKSLASTPTSSGKRVSHTQPREFKFLLSRVSQNFQDLMNSIDPLPRGEKNSHTMFGIHFREIKIPSFRSMSQVV